MFRFLVVGVFAVILVFLIIACTEGEGPLAPETPPVIRLTASLDEVAVEGQEDETIARAFEIIVSDTTGDPLPEIPVRLTVVSGPGAAVVEPASSASGVIHALYYVSLPVGNHDAVVRAYAGADSAQVVFHLNGHPKPSSIGFTSDDYHLSTRYQIPGEISMTISVVNRIGLPCEGVNVAFWLASGEGSVEPLAVTDSLGAASVAFTADGNWFGEALVMASVTQQAPVLASSSMDFSIKGLPLNITSLLAGASGSPLTCAARIEVECASHVGLHFLTPDQEIIRYSAVSSVPLSLALIDDDGRPISGESIELEASLELGTVPARVVTDRAGRASANLVLAENPVSGSVQAALPSLGLYDEISLAVVPGGPLTASFEFLDAGSAVWKNTTYNVRVAVRYQRSGGPVVGAPLALLSALGNPVVSQGLTDRNGRAEYVCIAEKGGEETLTLELDGEEVPNASFQFDILQGDIQFEGELLPPAVGVPGAGRRFLFRLTDEIGLPAWGELVEFSTTTGVFLDLSVETDWDGRGETFLSRGENAPREGMITARWRTGEWQETVEWDPLPVGRLEVLSESWKMTIPDGGRDSLILRIVARTTEDELLDYPWPVFLELRNEPLPPRGCVFENGLARDTVDTQDGVGFITLKSGLLRGGKLLRVSTWSDSNRTREIELIVSRITVIAGPPAWVSISEYEEAENAGDGRWSMAVRLTLYDRHNNWIRETTPLLIQRDDSPPDTFTYSWDHVCFNLVYFSEETFNVVNLKVFTSDMEMIGSRLIKLPLQYGQLTLEVDTNNFFFESPDDTMIIQVRARLTDWHGVLINNAPVIFSSNRARFFWRNHETDRLVSYFPAIPRKFTGVVDQQNHEQPGEATVFLIATLYDLDIDPFSLEVTIQINAKVEGYDEVAADPAFVFVTWRR